MFLSIAIHSYFLNLICPSSESLRKSARLTKKKKKKILDSSSYLAASQPRHASLGSSGSRPGPSSFPSLFFYLFQYKYSFPFLYILIIKCYSSFNQIRIE